MAAEWKEIWVPDASTYDEDHFADKWRHYAEQIKDELPKSSKPLNWMPSYQEFQAAAGKASGGAGFDGWHSSELKLTVKHFNFLIEELYTLWRTTATYLVTAITDKELQLLIMHWRVVGIPKKDPKQSRPISVGSCLFRAWFSACEPSLADPGEDQYACKKGCSVVHAVFG